MRDSINFFLASLKLLYNTAIHTSKKKSKALFQGWWSRDFYITLPRHGFEPRRQVIYRTVNTNMCMEKKPVEKNTNNLKVYNKIKNIMIKQVCNKKSQIFNYYLWCDLTKKVRQFSVKICIAYYYSTVCILRHLDNTKV